MALIVLRTPALLLGLLSLLPQEDPSAQARTLIEKLRSDSVGERRDAEQALYQLGKSAFPELLVAAADPDPNRRPVVRHLFFRITLGAEIAGKLERAMPELSGDHPWEADSTWTELFLEVTQFRGKDEDPEPLRSQELEVLLPVALRGAKDADEIDEILGRATGHRVYGAVPEIARRLSDPDPKIRAHSVSRLRILGVREHLPEMLLHLEDPDPEVRTAAFEAASMFQATEATPKLLELLRDPRTDCRRQAADALGLLQARGAVGPLMPLLRDEEVTCRGSAAGALVRLRAYDRIPELVALQKSGIPEARHAALEVLAGLEVAEAVPGLKACLHDPRVERRLWAIEMLGRQNAPGVIQDLVAMLEDRDLQVLRWALQSLKERKAREGIPKILPLVKNPQIRAEALGYVVAVEAKETVPQLLELLKTPELRIEILYVLGMLRDPASLPAILRRLDDADRLVHDAAMQALIRIGGRESIPALEGRMESEDSYTRTEAIAALGELGSKSSIPLLRKKIESSPEWDRVCIGESLLRLGDPQGAEMLFDALQHGFDQTRIRAIQGLTALQPPGLLEPVRNALKDTEKEVRDAAIEYLESHRCKSAIPDLFPFLKTDVSWYYPARLIVEVNARETIPQLRKMVQEESPVLRARMAGVLAALGARESIPDILALLENPETALPAIDALGDLGAVEALPQIRGFLDHDNPDLRRMAAVALGKLGVRDIIPDLVRLLRDPDRNVALNAAESLVELGARSAVPDLRRLLAGGEDLAAALAKLGAPVFVEDLYETAVNRHDSFPLNAIRRPEAWSKLEGRVYVRHPEDSIREALERMAREAGLPIAWPEGPVDLAKSQWDYRSEWASDLSMKQAVSPRSSLLRALERSASDAYCAVVIENDRIRILSQAAARDFWKAWWNAERPK
jgi:HEAT repeat protein